jgi:hypothetical protein
MKGSIFWDVTPCSLHKFIDVSVVTLLLSVCILRISKSCERGIYHKQYAVSGCHANVTCVQVSQ